MQREKNLQLLKTWCDVELRKPEFFEVFVRHGLDSLDTAKRLEQSEIKRMVTLLWHQLKIMHCVEKLKKESMTATIQGRSALRTWFHETVKLPKYFSLFVRNDIDDLETAKLIEHVDELKEIGIVSFG